MLTLDKTLGITSVTCNSNCNLLSFPQRAFKCGVKDCGEALLLSLIARSSNTDALGWLINEFQSDSLTIYKDGWH